MIRKAMEPGGGCGTGHVSESGAGADAGGAVPGPRGHLIKHAAGREAGA
jgi:hypothetical protein